MIARKSFKSVLQEYLAPAGIGAVAGLIATLATTVPQLMDKTQQILEQRRQLQQIEQEMSAYSKVIRKIYPLLTAEALATLFEHKGKTLINVDKGRLHDDDYVSAELRISPEGAYFIWCRTGMNSEYAGASLGFWLTRREALLWAHTYATGSEFEQVFGNERQKPSDKDLQVALCD